MPASQSNGAGGGLTVSTCVKNEAPYLLEWIAHYRLLGCEQIIISDNDSDDLTAERLAPLNDAGIITLRRQPDVPGQAPQRRAFEETIKLATAEWFTLLDADEFLLVDNPHGVASYLAGFAGDVAQIRINWRVFGSSGHQRRSPGIIAERFQLCARDDHWSGKFIKSISRKSLIRQWRLHSPVMVKGARHVRADGSTLDQDIVADKLRKHNKADTVVTKGARINHYMVKSVEEYSTKRSRGRGLCNEGDPRNHARFDDLYFKRYDRNSVTKAPSAGYVGAMKNEIGRLLETLHPEDRAYYTTLYGLAKPKLYRIPSLQNLFGAAQRKAVIGALCLPSVLDLPLPV
jgi:glycosyltransferase involved in cell wall biosynthesis